MFHLLEATGIIVCCAVPATKTAPAASPDLTSNPLVDVIIGGFIAAGASFLVSFFSNKQQLKRDQQAHEHQLEREQLAYERTVKDAKRGRILDEYKVIINAAEAYEAAIHRLNYIAQGETKESRNERLNASLKNELTGVNQAMISITLEDVGTDVKTILGELRQAFNSFVAKRDSNDQFPRSFSQEDLDKDKNTVVEKVKELRAVMQKHLRELES